MASAPQPQTRPLRVLFILTALHKNGAVLSTLTTLKNLDRARFTPKLFVMERQGGAWGELLAGTEVVYGLGEGERLRSRLRRVLPKLLRLASDSDILVGGLEMAPTFLAVAAGKLTGKPSVGFVRNSLPELLESLPAAYRRLTKLLYPRLTHAVAISSGIQESVEALVPRLKGRVSTVYIPLDLERVKARAQVPLPAVEAHRPYLVAVGRLERQKGFDVLLRAYAALSDRPEQLVIVGEGKERARLGALSRELGIEERVVFAGFRENPYAWMRHAEVFVSSSRFEGFCRVIAEALAVGTPVVATDCPSGPAEVLQEGQCGVLVPNEDARALAEGLRRVLTDRALRARLRACGRERAQDFSPEVTVRAFEGVLERLLRAHAKTSVR